MLEDEIGQQEVLDMADKTDRFAARLKELREAAGLTQDQLAAKAGLHIMGIGKLEQGTRKPAWDTVVALSEALNVPCQAFLEEPKPPAEAKPKKAKGK
jgi:transcriptional regulator with XRE-family HTH domain